MNGKGNDARVRASRDGAAAEGRAQGLDVGWAVSGYLISGMVAYGGIGWLIGRAVHVSLLFPIGMLIGLAISTGFIIYRYGKQGAVAIARPARKEMTGDR
jgi:F0F1-type ATP synthase assembly protein I